MTKTKSTKPAAVAKGRAPQLDKAAAAARDAALDRVHQRATPAPAPAVPATPPAAQTPSKKDA